MGIPQLLGKIENRYPRSVITTTGPSQPVDILVIDVPNYISKYFFVKKARTDYTNLIAKAISKLDSLIQFTNPKSVIYLSFECMAAIQPWIKVGMKRYRSDIREVKAEKNMLDQIEARQGVVTTEEETFEEELPEIFMKVEKTLSKIIQKHWNNI